MNEDTYPNAGRDSGYVDEEGKPVGEDLVNKVAVLIAGVQTNLVVIRGDIAEQKKSLDTMVTTMQHIAQTVVNIAEAQKKTDSRMAKLERRMDTSEEDRRQINERLARIEARLEAHGDGNAE